MSHAACVLPPAKNDDTNRVLDLRAGQKLRLKGLHDQLAQRNGPHDQDKPKAGPKKSLAPPYVSSPEADHRHHEETHDPAFGAREKPENLGENEEKRVHMGLMSAVN